MTKKIHKEEEPRKKSPKLDRAKVFVIENGPEAVVILAALYSLLISKNPEMAVIVYQSYTR